MARLKGGGGGSVQPKEISPKSNKAAQQAIAQLQGTNYLEIASYLRKQGFSNAAAAGITGTIAGESSGNPESVGSGGWGLIGWTPQYPGEYQNLYPTGNVKADLAKQLRALITYAQTNSPGNWPYGGTPPYGQNVPLGNLQSVRSPGKAAQIWSAYYERPASQYSDIVPSVVNDVYTAETGSNAAAIANWSKGTPGTVIAGNGSGAASGAGTNSAAGQNNGPFGIYGFFRSIGKDIAGGAAMAGGGVLIVTGLVLMVTGGKATPIPIPV